MMLNRLGSLALLAATAASAHADYSTIEVDSVATEVLGTPVAIHRVYARIANPALRVQLVSDFDIMVGSALFYHRDFETGGALSTELGTWHPYQCTTAMAAGDSYVIGGGSAGAAAAGSILFSNWADLEFATAQPTFDGEGGPGVQWGTLDVGQSFPDANGRVHLAQFVTRREDAFTARLKVSLYGPVYSIDFHTVDVTLGLSADDCPDDPSKILPGQCGCGGADIDSDGDGAANCLDHELALAQSLDCTAPELFLGIGTASEIRVDGDLAIVGSLTSTDAYGTATLLRRAADKNGVFRWVPEAHVGGTAPVDQSTTDASIAIDGTRAAVRVRRGPSLDGVVQLLERATDGTWALVREFEPDLATNTLTWPHGRSIDLHGDWLAISTMRWFTLSPPVIEGTIDLYHRDRAGWTLATSIKRETPQLGQSFGEQVVLGDGILVASDGQALFVYRLQPSGNNWEFVQQLATPDGFSVSDFGESLALDGDVLVAGCSSLYSGTPHAIGGAVVYRLGADGFFAQEAVLRPEERALPLADIVYPNSFGESVTVSGDVIAVGGSATDRAYVFRRGTEGAWRCAHVIARNLSDTHRFGRGLAIAGDQLLVGASDTGSIATLQPRIDVFDLDPARFGDLDHDGTIGPGDLAILLQAWGAASGPEDLDGDGVVGPRDLVLILGGWTAP